LNDSFSVPVFSRSTLFSAPPKAELRETHVEARLALITS